MDISDEEIARAEQRGRELLEHFPVVTNVRYDSRHSRILFDLSDGVELAVQVARLNGLERATDRDIAIFEISPSGLGVHFPTLDADLYLPSLLRDRT